MKVLEQVTTESRRRRLSRDNKWHKASVSDDRAASHETHDIQINECFEDFLSEKDDFCRVNHEFELIEDEIQIESYDEVCENVEVEEEFDTDFEKDSVIALI